MKVSIWWITVLAVVVAAKTGNAKDYEQVAVLHNLVHAVKDVSSYPGHASDVRIMVATKNMNKLAASYKTTGSTPVQITPTYSYPVPITSAVAVPTRSYSTPTYQTPAKLGLVYPAPIYTERTKSTVPYQAPAKFNIAVHAPAYPASVKTTPYQLPTKHSGQPARPVNAGDSKPILTAYQAPTKFTSNHKVMYPVPTTYSATAMMAPVYPLSTYPTSVYRLQTYPAVI